MSDGPHRSLNMRRGWKRLAESAANIAFDDRETRDALAEALRRDWVDEVPENFLGHVRDALDDHQGSLFGTSVTDKLEALRGEAAGRPLAGAVLDFAAQAADQGLRGEEALAKAAADALRERAASGRRQVEEHWLRASRAGSAEAVTNRIDGAIASSDMNDIARCCIGRTDGRASQAPRRKTGIDDGVSLS